MWTQSIKAGFGLKPNCIRFSRLLHICVVGSGPAGFYTTDKLLKFSEQAKIDVLERLPVPFGLVRSGVAPDHPETKVVINQFTKIASNPRVSFFGNVHVGKDVSLQELRSLYNVVVLAYGSESDNALGIPGETLPGVFSAREFVWWYNGHPDCAELPVDLRSSDTAVVLGQGNVAIDVARILLRPVQDLSTTDIANHAIMALQSSNIRRVYLVGRRGPAQIACTAKELRELLGLKGVNVIVQSSDLVVSDVDKKEMEASRIQNRVYGLLCKAAETKTRPEYNKELRFVFYRQPVEVIPSDDGKQVSGVKLEKTVLKQANGKQIALGTGTYETLSGGLVLKSIGYKSLPVDGLPFDQKKGIVPNINGRVVKVSGTNEPVTEPGLYVVGWLKRGPTGIIGTNLVCAEEVTHSIIEDDKSGLLPKHPSQRGTQGLIDLLKKKQHKYVTFDAWKKIDAFEISEGSKIGKLREKLVSVTRTLKLA